MSIISLGDAHGDSVKDAVSMNGPGPRHPENSSQDVRGVAWINLLSEAFELWNILLDVGQDF